MTRFLVRDPQGAPFYEYQYDTQLNFEAWPTPPYSQEVVPEDEVVPLPYAGSWRITKLAFRNRFTQAEKVAIEIAALDNPAAPMEQRAMSAALRASQQDVAVATFIDLQRADTRGGVQMLESAGLLAAGRSATILDTVPADAELYQ